ncbi:MAG TPA: YihY/virulence factor BrkB family protein [Bdellovibrionota bacterium]|nr:YihY/virulence factor BrkB family protein [Bdellovibrionota bacterium]
MKTFEGVSRKGVHGRPWKQFFRDLKNEIKEDNVTNGAAALGFYLMLAIFPAMIFLLSLLPYLPIPNLQQAVMDLLNQALPGEASMMFTGTVNEVVGQKKGGLLSFGALLTIWAASAGMYAVMQQLNITYDVKEGRPFWKARGTAIVLTLFFGVLIVGAFGLIVGGGALQAYLLENLGGGQVLMTVFSVVRWLIIAAALTLAFAITYRFAPDVKQRFAFVTPGSLFGVILLVVATLGFKFYVDGFGKYSATYGSIGAVIALMLWLNIVGLVLLLGSEVNALVEHYSPKGKQKGEKVEGQKERRAA